MACKFKINDVIICIQNNGYEKLINIGDYYVVTGHNEFNNLHLKNINDHENFGLWDERFVLVTDLSSLSRFEKVIHNIE